MDSLPTSAESCNGGKRLRSCKGLSDLLAYVAFPPRHNNIFSRPKITVLASQNVAKGDRLPQALVIHARSRPFLRVRLRDILGQPFVRRSASSLLSFVHLGARCQMQGNRERDRGCRGRPAAEFPAASKYRLKSNRSSLDKRASFQHLVSPAL